jgi:hypothetical protein
MLHPHKSADDGQTGLRPESCSNDCLTRRKSIRPCVHRTLPTRLERHVRRYPNGKLLIKPSKKSVGTFLNSIRRIIKTAHGVSAADLIDQLNPKIRGWANYHRHVVSKHTLGHVQHLLWSVAMGTTKAPEQKPALVQTEIL